MSAERKLPGELTFRPATLADAEVVSAVYLASRKRFLPYAPLPHTDDDVSRYVRETLIPKTDVRVALLDGRIVGLMALLWTNGCGWIEQLYLHPDAVGMGIGSQFVEQAKQILGSPIRLYTFQANEGARRFYERHGFKVLAFGDGSENEERCPDVLYEWKGD